MCQRPFLTVEALRDPRLRSDDARKQDGVDLKGECSGGI